MTRQRFHVPCDDQVHALQFTGEPEDLAVADMGIEFWAEPGAEVRLVPGRAGRLTAGGV